MPTLKTSFVRGRVFFAGAVLAGCGLINPNILDTTINLQQQTYTQDFGNNTGTLMSPPCAGVTPDPCALAANNVSVGNDTVTAVCDTAANKCVATASVVVSQQVNLSSEPSFPTQAVSALQAVTLYYGVAQNSLTFDTPPITVYVGPNGSTSPTSQGVAQVGTIPTIASHATTADKSASFQVQNGSPAWNVLLNSVVNPKVPFVVLLTASTTIHDGERFPAGAITLHVNPAITIGIPR